MLSMHGVQKFLPSDSPVTGWNVSSPVTQLETWQPHESSSGAVALADAVPLAAALPRPLELRDAPGAVLARQAAERDHLAGHGIDA